MLQLFMREEKTLASLGVQRSIQSFFYLWITLVHKLKENGSEVPQLVHTHHCLSVFYKFILGRYLAGHDL